LNRLPTFLGGLFAFAVIFFPLMLFFALNIEDPPPWVPIVVTIAVAVLAATFANAAVRGTLRRRSADRRA
jgi:hypothetical protein